MKKLILSLLCFAVIISCKKQNAVPEVSGDQLLTKVTMTTGAISYSINYGYNNAGKLIKEGNKTYYRDDKQRIARITDPGAATGRDDIQVYYGDPLTNKVSYTFCTRAGGDAADSLVYLHDSNGRLIKTMNYFSSFTENKTPDTTFLSHCDVFTYDADGNLIRVDDYNIDNGNLYHCGQFNFINYSKSINPLYTDDEVRIMEFEMDALLNTSINNFTRIGDYSKSYELRPDGRPSSCTVHQAGASDFTLIFEYK